MLLFSNKTSFKSIPLFIIFSLFIFVFTSDCINSNEVFGQDIQFTASDFGSLYLRKINDSCYLVGNEKAGATFKIQENSDANIIQSIESLGDNYKVYTDVFGNLNPEIGISENELKYIISEQSIGVYPAILELSFILGKISSSLISG